MSIFTRGLDELRDVATADLRWLLLKSGYTFDRDDATLTDLVLASNEITAAGYARVDLTGGTRSVDDVNNRVTYLATDPDFGSLTTGQTVVATVLYRFVTNDADSIPIAHYAVGPVDTATIDPFVVTFTDSTLAYVDEA